MALNIVSGNNQTGAPGGLVPAALVVSVSGSAGPLVGAPVTFTVSGGGGQLKKSEMSAYGNSVTVLTDAGGEARVYFQLPNAASQTSVVTATAGAAAPASFSESSDGGTGGGGGGGGGSGSYDSPFAATNATARRNADGSIDMTWQNNTDDPADIPIYLDQPDGSWKKVMTVPAGTTSVHIPPQ